MAKKPPIKHPDIYVGGKSKSKPKQKPRMTDKLRQRGEQFNQDYPQMTGSGEFARDVKSIRMKGSNRRSQRRSAKS